MRAFFGMIYIRYIDRFRRYREWKKIYLKNKWDLKLARAQAWRESAWYDPTTGRSVELMETMNDYRFNRRPKINLPKKKIRIDDN